MRRLVLMSFLTGLGAASVAGQEITVSGRVVDEAGRPLERAVVVLVATPDLFTELEAAFEGEQLAALDTAETDTLGRYVIRAPEPGMYRLHVWAEGRPEVVHRLEPLMRSMGVLPLEVRPGRPFSVSVRAADGSAVEGALLRFWARDETPFEWHGQEGQRRINLAPVRLASVWRRTDRDGHAEWTIPQKSTGALGAAAPGWASWWRRLEDPGETLEVVLKPAAERTLEVLDGAGKPIENAMVTAGRASIAIGRTDDEGRVVVDVPRQGSEPFQVVLPRVGGRSVELSSESPASTEVTIATELVAGAVVDAAQGPVVQGQGVPGAIVYAPGNVAQWTTTSSSGAFEVEVLGGHDRVGFGAQAPGYFPRDILVVSRSEAGTWPEVSLALEPGVFLSGRVVDDLGTPVEDALLLLQALDRQEPTLRAASAVDGSFSVVSLAADAAYQLRVEASGFPDRVQVLPAFELRSAPQLEVVLPRGGEVRGLLVDDAGQPVAGAEVLATTARELGRGRFSLFPEGKTGSSDGSGGFCLGALAVGKHDVNFQASGFMPKTVRGVEIGSRGEVVDLGEIMLAAGALVEGRVIDEEGLPVVGAGVYFDRQDEPNRTSRHPEREPPDVVSDVEGTFEARDFRQGERLLIIVRSEGYGQVALSVQAPTEEPVEIPLSRGHSLAGRVIDAEGNPVTEAGFHLLPREIRRGAGLVRYGTDYGRVDTEGRFLAEHLDAGTYHLRVQGQQGAAELEVEIPQVEPVLVELKGERRLSGRVLSPEGRPLEGASVFIETWTESSSSSHGTSTGPEGRFSEVVSSGERIELRVEFPDTRPYRRWIELGEGNTEVEIRLEPGLEIRGRVVDETGEPVAGALVRAVRPGPSSSSSSAAASDTSGHFRIRSLGPGTLFLNADKQGYVTLHEEALTVENASIEGIELLLGRGVTVVGRVVGGDPDLLEKATMQVWPLTRAASSSFDLFSQRRTRTSLDANGEFHLDPLGAGGFNVSLSTPGGELRESRTVVLRGDEGVVELLFDLSRGQTLRGVVKNQGEPIAGAVVWVSWPTRPESRSARTDAGGRFEIRGLTPGEAVVRATTDGRIIALKTVELPLADDLMIELQQPVVRGMVVERETGRPLAAAEVMAHLDTGFATNPVRTGSATSRENGSFEIPLAPGRHRLVVSAEGFASRSLDVVVEDGSPLEQVVELERSPGLLLRVSSAEGSLVRQVNVFVEDSRGLHWSGSVSLDGEQQGRFDSLAAGSYRLFIREGNGPMVEQVATVPGEVVVKLPLPGHLIVEVPRLLGTDETATLVFLNEAGTPYRFLQQSLSPGLPVVGGQAVLSNVPVGFWRVEVTTAEGDVLSANAVVEPFETTHLVIDG